MLYQSPLGSTAYAIGVRLVANDALTLTDCEIACDFDDQIVLASFIVSTQSYIHGGREFSAEEILNERLLRSHGLYLCRGRVVEGIILASGRRPIPTHLPYGARLGCCCTFWDQHGHALEKQMPLILDCHPRKVDPVRPMGGGSLYKGVPGFLRQDVVAESHKRYLETLRASPSAQTAGEKSQTDREANRSLSTYFEKWIDPVP